jgi:hypothetical protein
MLEPVLSTHKINLQNYIWGIALSYREYVRAIGLYLLFQYPVFLGFILSR